MALYDTVKQAIRMETGRALVLRQATVACRKGGKVSLEDAPRADKIFREKEENCIKVVLKPSVA